MKTIKSFEASGVYGYLKMKLILNEQLTFLYGLNGSGKTSALNLIMALLEPSLETLIRIPFKRIELQGVTEKYGEVEIVAEKNNENHLMIKCSVVPEETLSLTIEKDDLDAATKLDMVFREVRSSPVFTAIAEISPPIFLGIDRRFRAPTMPFHRRQSPSARQMAFEHRRRERSTEDPFYDPGLDEAAYIIEDFKRQLRREQMQIDNQFRRQILLDSFVYFDPETTKTPDRFSKSMIKKFKSKKDTIVQTLNSLDLASEELEKRSEEFFDKVENINSIIEKLTKEKDNKGESSETLGRALTAWFINWAQVDRIDSLFDLANHYREKQENIMKPLNQFIELINRFFNQIDKEIIIDQAGEVEIRLQDRPFPLNSLSSGERQIFIILAHLSLNKTLRQDGVFMVDEPELSLHMAWQDMFVEAVETANPKLQIILATHAPSIIGGRDSLCIPVSSVEDN